jgi:hypothetical protein
MPILLMTKIILCFLLTAFWFNTVTAQQKKIKTWQVASSIMGMTAIKAENLIKSYKYSISDRTTGYGMDFRVYEDESNQFYDPDSYIDAKDAFSTGVKNNKVGAIVFMIGETDDDEDLAASKEYSNFEKQMLKAGFRLISKDDEDEDMESRYFHHRSKKQKVKTTLVMEDGVVALANVILYNDNIDIDGDGLDAGPAVLFQDLFTDNKNKWLVQTTDQFVFKISGGKYQIESKKGGSWFATIPLNLQLDGDFEISASIKKTGGTDAYYFGLVLGFNLSSKHHHFVGISGGGNFVLANKGPSPKDIIPTATNSAVEKENSINAIVLKKIGNNFKLYINHELVGTAPFEPFYGKSFGFQVWSGNSTLSIEIDDFAIKKY